MPNIDNFKTSCCTIETSISILLVFFGTAISISSKALMNITCTAYDDHGTPKVVPFDKPLFVTFGIFLAETSVLILHWAVMIFKLEFPGYKFCSSKEGGHDTQNSIHETIRIVTLVGVAAILAGARGEGGRVHASATETLLGATLVMLGNIFQALTAVTEEHILKMENPIPPLLVVGMHGFWAAVLCVAVLFPIAYWVPGNDRESNLNMCMNFG
eukprot:scaffold35859_cov72-Cyclotella_meneghiniana.AAC.4